MICSLLAELTAQRVFVLGAMPGLRSQARTNKVWLMLLRRQRRGRIGGAVLETGSREI